MESNRIVRNTAALDVELCGQRYTLNSNETVTEVVRLTVQKQTNCKFAIAGGGIEYAVTVCNESDVNLSDLEFRDILARNTEYKAGSFTVNGKPAVPVVNNNALSYKIDELKSNEQLKITFEVKVLC